MKETIEGYVTITEATKLIKPNCDTISYILSKEDFSSQIKFIKRKILIPKLTLNEIEDYYEKNKALYEKYSKSDDHINPLRMSNYLGITLDELMMQVYEGIWNGKFIRIPKLSRPKKNGQDDYNYFFIRSLTVLNYKSLYEIAAKNKDIIVTSETMTKYARDGLLPQPSHLKGTKLYDEKEVLTSLKSIREGQILSEKEKLKASTITRYSLLNDHQKNAIDKFINFRRNNGIIDFNGFRTKDQIAHKEKTLKSMERNISSAFVLIISGRCGIDEEIIVNNKINEDVIREYNPDVFDFLSINVEDYFYLSSKREKGTLKHYSLILKQFYYYYLQQLELESVISEKKHREFLVLNLKVKQFLNQFPRESKKWYSLDESKSKKSFLTPEQMIKVRDLILSDPLSQYPLKYASIWQLGCSTGIRPEEQMLVRIEHFLLDNQGYLKLNNRGWGILRLPVEASKHENSPSHVIYGTPIPKETVKLINQYLQKLYSIQGSKTGYGYLFRPNPSFPDMPYNNFDKRFLKRISPLLTFLTPEQRDNFILKSSRHSLNNFISKTYLPVQELNGNIQKVAAQYQMRHKPKDTTIGDDFYSALITEDDFYRVLDLTISFPWNLEQLELWKIKQGYKKAQNNEPESPQGTKILENQTKVSFDRINQIENQLSELRTRPKTMNVKEWTLEVNKLKKEKNSLLSI